MNRQRHQSFEPQQFEQHHAVVQGLRDALLSAINQIKSLKEENKSLKDKMDLQENQRRQAESQLQEELRLKDKLLKRNIKERQECTEAHIDVLAPLAQKEAELESREARCGALEVNLQELVQREEDWSRRVEEAELEETLAQKKREEKTRKEQEQR